MFVLSSQVLAQKGFKYITKAKRKYECGQYNSTIHLLAKANKENYGFCGNAWVEAKRDIYELYGKIFFQLGAYDSSRKYFNSNFCGADKSIDSLIVRSYQLQYGISNMKKIIDTGFIHSTIKCPELYCFLIVPFNNNKDSIKLRLKGYQVDNLVNIDENMKTEVWREMVRKSYIFHQIIN